MKTYDVLLKRRSIKRYVLQKPLDNVILPYLKGESGDVLLICDDIGESRCKYFVHDRLRRFLEMSSNMRFTVVELSDREHLMQAWMETLRGLEHCQLVVGEQVTHVVEMLSSGVADDTVIESVEDEEGVVEDDGSTGDMRVIMDRIRVRALERQQLKNSLTPEWDESEMSLESPALHASEIITDEDEVVDRMRLSRWETEATREWANKRMYE